MNCNTMADESGDAGHTNFVLKIITNSNAKEVLSENTPYVKKNANMTLTTYLEMFQKVDRASAYFTTDGTSDAYEHITRQHVRDIMGAYEPYLKDPPTFTFTLTFGNEYHRILRNIALTMQSWK